MIKLVDAKITDPYLIEDLLPCFTESDREVVAKNIALGNKLSFSLITEKEVLGCIGGVQWLPGVFGIWALLSKKVKDHGYSYHRTVFKMIRKALQDPAVNRIQVLVDKDNEEGIKQNKAFGFKNEGLLRGVGFNGEDQFILGIVKGDF